MDMGRCSDRDELRKIIESASDDDRSFLVERYIDAVNEHSLIGISIKGSIKALAGFRSVMPGHNERQGVAVMGVTEKDGHFAPLLKSVDKLMASVGYTGMFDIDLMEDRQGDMYFMEINFRAGASCHAFSYKGGLNIPALYAGHALRGQDISYRTIEEEDKLFLSEKALLEEFVKGDIDKKEMDRCLREAGVYFIRDDNDPEPYGIFRKYLRMAPILRTIYKLK